MSFKKILIANRGEIACRIIKTAKKMGILTVAVYSEIDANALHVQMADECIGIGPAPSVDSYLNAEKIIQAAITSGAQAIHPGYGFLSEDADFAQLCLQNHIVFVGPPPAAIRVMGDKELAKTTMTAAGVPVVPGYQGDMSDQNALQKVVQSIGLPVLIKASAGGGGKGMRLVQDLQHLSEAINGAIREAKSSFGDDRVFIEKYLARSRHVEVQILFDQYGQGFYLFDRDCSIQRRHQKIIEEAPAPGLRDSTRKKMAETALRAGTAIKYSSTGTIEFLVDENENFYFMEMNTRLQVEHPVTEMICGIDLVEWQLRIAAGEKIKFKQKDIKAHGHAIEARLYAENPQKNFMPSAGVLEFFHLPEATERQRVDSGFLSGDQVSVYYDPLLAKLIAWGETRQQAISQLQVMLSQTAVLGIHTNETLLYRIAAHPQFNQGILSTHFISANQEELLKALPEPPPPVLVFAAVSIIQQQTKCWQNYRQQTEDENSPWLLADSWRLFQTPFPFQREGLSQGGTQLVLWFQQKSCQIIIHGTKPDYQLYLNDHKITVTILEEHKNKLILKINTQIEQAIIFVNKEAVTVFYQGCQWLCSSRKLLPETATGKISQGVLAPMPGTLIEILVHEGQSVKPGERLLILEAMKMEHVMNAMQSGTVAKIFYKKGDRVQEGAQLISFDFEAV